MKKEGIILILLLTALFLLITITSCTTKCPDCICPEKECPACPETDITKCPQIIETKEVKVVRYVCEDKTVVEKEEDCFPETGKSSFTPVTSNEGGTAIEYATVAPSCFGNYRAVYIRFKTKSIPGNVSFELKEPGQEFREIKRYKGTYEGGKYLIICNDCNAGDYQLKTDKEYLLRVKFDQMRIYGRYDYSNEHIIDTRRGSDYEEKKC